MPVTRLPWDADPALHPFRSGAILGLATLLLAGCAGLPDTRKVAVEGRQVEFALAGTGSPVVVLETGLGARKEWWAKVMPHVASTHTVLAYNRAGYGNSDSDGAPPDTPRDGDHVLVELRALLRQLDLKPPYILVGHSLGGLYMQLYARRYPEETAALVLVDSTHPEQMRGVGAPEQWPAWLRAVFNVGSSPTAKAELAAVDATGAAVLALPPPKGKPVIVLSAAKPLGEHSPLADDANAKRRDIVRLHPGARQVWVDSGHAIPLERPDAIVDAIQQATVELKRAAP